MRARTLLIVATVCAFSAVVVAGSTTWKLYSFNRSGQALRASVVSYDIATDTVMATLPETSDAAYLTSNKVGTFGDLTGKTLSASVSIAATAATTFAAYPDGCNPTGADPTVGLYFQTKGTGGFDPSTYWWSGQRVKLSTLVDTPTLLTRAVSDGQWTNYNGQTDGFAAAAANVVTWGVSFGGGCHYANGVGTPTGQADFSLTVNPVL